MSKKEKPILELNMDQIDRIMESISAFRLSGGDKHYINDDTLLLSIYKNGKIRLNARFETDIDEEFNV